MTTISAIGAALATTALSLVVWPAKHGWAQVVLERQSSTPTAETAASSGATTTALVVMWAVAVLVILATLAKAADLRRKRDLEAVVIQARVSDALLRDPRLFSLPIAATAHVPLWKGSPVTITVTGQVPSEDLRQTALRLIEREAFQVRQDLVVESRMGLAPAMARRSA
jgi:hypothetical protein